MANRTTGENRTKTTAVLFTVLMFLLISVPLLSVSYAGTSWSPIIVDSTGDVGKYSSIALDSSGKPVISYYDATNMDLKVAFWNGANWNSYIAASDGDVGMYSSIAIDSGDTPWISYYNATGDTLNCAHWAGYWATETVGIIGDVSLDPLVGRWGMYSSIALDSAGNPHISYYDSYPHHDLKIAVRSSGSGWWRETVDSDGDVGQFSSLALDSNGNEHISYYDRTNTALKIARWSSGSGWQNETVDGRFDERVGMYPSLALDSNGNEHISYYDDVHGNLNVADFQGLGWGMGSVDSAGDVGMFSSLALDSAGNPCISYYDATNGALKYVHKAGDHWPIETVDIIGDVGMYSSLALDSAGNPHISYYDATNGDLRYASLIPALPTGSIIINGGAAFTSSTSVTLTLTYAAYRADVTQVRYSNDGVWDTEGWEAPAGTKAWTLPVGDGPKTVYYQIKDYDGMLSPTYWDDIVLDTTPPIGSIVINNGDLYSSSTSVTLSLTYSDPQSGVLQVRYSNDGWWDFEIWQGLTSTKPWTLTSGDGVKTVYYQIQNNAELANTYSDTITLDTAPPTGSIVINNGDLFTSSGLVTLSLTYSDVTSGVYQVRYSNDGVWDSEVWEFPAAGKSWSLLSGAGVRTVYYQVKDNVGLTAVFSDTIVLNSVYAVVLNAGWNMVSFPVLPSDASFASIFAGKGYYQVLTWTGTSYVTATNVEAGKGYWVLVLSETALTIEGSAVDSFEVDLPAGWSMIGSVNDGVCDCGSVFPGYYQALTWSGTSYVTATTIEPGKGYWALVLAPTHITVD
jgi:hypothetical protein